MFKEILQNMANINLNIGSGNNLHQGNITGENSKTTVVFKATGRGKVTTNKCRVIANTVSSLAEDDGSVEHNDSDLNQ